MEKTENFSLANEMAKQLHEQYAANDNTKANNVIAILTAIAFVFVGFGYVYQQPYLKNPLMSIDCNYEQILLSVNVLADIILTLLAILCVSFGYSTRRDHIVISKIRKSKGIRDWYGNGCGKTLLNYLPNYYSIVFIFSMLFQLLLTIGICHNPGVKNCHPKCISFFILIVIYIITISYYLFNFCKYKKLK